MTKAPIPTELFFSKVTKRHKHFDYTAIADQLRTVSLCSHSHPSSDVVTSFNGRPPSPNCKSCVVKRIGIKNLKIIIIKKARTNSHSMHRGHKNAVHKTYGKTAVRSYGPDTDFGYVFTVTLTFEIWPWVKFMTHPWVMDNDCVKYYPDPTWQRWVMARTRIFWYVFTVTLTLEIWPWVKFMTHPWVMDNDCVKYYPDPTW